ncbi:MAG: heavy metal translocating P-type ATPase [Oscillospiraceae bacterium]|nr:heavy metal translocating P-type ATPase [Oscillospiraceae bacterium]
MKQYHVTGMSCAACSARVEKAVKGVAGVTECSVSLLTNSMIVEGTASEDAVIAAVTAAGYGAASKENKSVDRQDPQENGQMHLLRSRLISSLVFLIGLMYLSMGPMLWNLPLPAFLEGNIAAQGLMQLLLTVAIMVINGKFFISGSRSLLHRAPNMDTLVALGASAAFLYSVVLLFAVTDPVHSMNSEHVHFYFDSAGMILTLITVGKLLEERSKGKTTDALRSLMDLAPKTAVVLRNGKETEIQAAQVRKGDIFLVRPGASIPADGIVLEGQSAVDESALTGESIPIDKEKGDSVSAATLNCSGFLKCEAVRVGEDTSISRIIELVREASATKAPIARIADKAAGIFVPCVIGIALLTFLIWLVVGAQFSDALSRSISVLVISCPCALGLATPVAIMVGSGKGAGNGILFKTAASLEHCGKITIAALDKTGTITEGKPQVVGIYPSEHVTEQELLSAAYALEQHSEHPLARAITSYAVEKGLEAQEVTDFTAITGSGVSAILGNDTLLGGNRKFMEKQASIPDYVLTDAHRLAEEGYTPLFFSRNNEFLGMIAVADTMKNESTQAIRELHNMGIRTVMLTGDNERTANAIGNLAGVDEVIAGVLPDEKESVIRRLKTEGKVLMVGDGINDAPALTSADVGIAIGAGTDIAVDAADVILVKSRLTDVPAAIRLSRAVLRNIKQNLFWAFAYNIVGIPLAAGVWIPIFGWEMNPMFCAAAMSLSSFCVVSNALRLNLCDIHRSDKDKKIKKLRNKEKKMMTKTLNIEGMMCPHCEATVKKALEAIEGVESAEVSHKDGTAKVSLNLQIDDAVLKKAVEDKDFTVKGIQ